MGFFSWITSDTNESIPSRYSDRETFTVYLLSPDGNHIREDDYEGYGEFGGVDVFVFWMKWNKPELCEGKTDEEIRSLFFENGFFEEMQHGQINGGMVTIKLTTEPLPYDKVRPSEDCPQQGFFYD